MSALSGELSFASVSADLENADELIAGERVDLSAVTKADSAGLALLIELTRRAKEAGKTLRFTGAVQQVRDLIGFFDLDGVLQLDGSA